MLIISFNNSHNVMQLSYTFCHFPMDVLQQKQEREREREGERAREREREGERARKRESERERVYLCVCFRPARHAVQLKPVFYWPMRGSSLVDPWPCLNQPTSRLAQQHSLISARRLDVDFVFSPGNWRCHDMRFQETLFQSRMFWQRWNGPCHVGFSLLLVKVHSTHYERILQRYWLLECSDSI